jgi:hypothetical protein
MLYPSSGCFFSLQNSGLEPSCHNIIEHSDPDPEVSGPDLMVIILMVVRQVPVLVMVTVMIRLSEMKMTIISVRYHFVPDLVINYLKTDKCLFVHMNFFCCFLVLFCLNK